MNTDLPSTPAEIEQQKPEHWEGLLFATLLEEHLHPLHRQYDALPTERWKLPKRTADQAETLWFIQERWEYLTILMSRVGKLLNDDFPRAMGPSGISGNAAEIRIVAGAIASGCQSFFDWEISICSVTPHPVAAELYSRLYFITLPWFRQFEALPEKIRSIIQGNVPGTHHLKIHFDTPSLENLPGILPSDSPPKDSLDEGVELGWLGFEPPAVHAVSPPGESSNPCVGRDTPPPLPASSYLAPIERRESQDRGSLSEAEIAELVMWLVI